MAHGFCFLVLLAVLLSARSGFCRSMTGERSSNYTIGPQPKAAVTVGSCSSNPTAVTLNIGDYAEFSTPNYPQNYPRFHKCSWKFQAGANAKLSVDCPVVHLSWLATLYIKDGFRTIRKGCIICLPEYYAYDFTSTSAEIGLNNRFFFVASGFSCKITATILSGDTTTAPPSGNTTTAPPSGNTTTAPPSGDCKCGVPVRTSRIVGGVETEEHEYPWMALLIRRGGSYFCGGSIVNNKFILTAAHCTDGQTASAIGVRLGLHENNSPFPGSALYRDVLNIVQHSSYGDTRYNNDIALLEVAVIDFSSVGPTIRPICIPSGNSNYEGDTATVAGWGRTTPGGSSPGHLREVDVPVISNTLCSTYYGSSNIPITSNMICAGIVGKDSCQGDSGGPIFKISSSGKYVDQIGIVSWGIGCALDKYPGVYARVTELRSWLISNTAGSSTCAPPS